MILVVEAKNEAQNCEFTYVHAKPILSRDQV